MNKDYKTKVMSANAFKPMHEIFKREYLMHFDYLCPHCKKLLAIGIYKCRICGKPISDHQFEWSGLCAPCDMGKRAAKTWIIRCNPSEDFDWVTFRNDLDRAISLYMYENMFMKPKTTSPIMDLLKYSWEKCKKQETEEKKR